MPNCWICGSKLSNVDDDMWRCEVCKEKYPDTVFQLGFPSICDACGRKHTRSNPIGVFTDGVAICALCTRIDSLVENGQIDYTVAQSIISDEHIQS